MKATLVKKQANWYNLYQNDIGIGSTHAELQGYKLSLKNCQEIELGFDLDDIKRKVFDGFDGRPDSFTIAAVERTIQIMVELMGDKKFTEEDVLKAIEMYYGKDKIFIEIIQSLQHVEWDVTVEMEYVGECNGNNDEGCFQDSPGHNCGCFERRPKLDKNEWLILKRI